ncbi:MAG: DNRLRE domain-containing protein [Melioribacteraceae bacterium]|nr:DNRLRE domain-containing protein [Melioribacteraceae bacterium]
MKQFFSHLVLFLIVILSACEEDPTSVGEDLIDNQDLINVYFYDSRGHDEFINSKSYIDTLSLGISERTLLGRSGSISSTAALKFYFPLPDSIENAINDGTLTPLSSWIKLIPNYYYGEANGNFGLTAHKITESWGSGKFKIDTLKNLQYEPQNYAGQLSINDTIVIINLDEQLSYEWLLSRIDESAHPNYGVILIPTQSTSKIIGFLGITSATLLGALPEVHLVVEKPGEFIDTLTATPIIDAFGVEGPFPQADETISFVQGGIPVQTSLKFDISSLPQTAIILKADLTLHTDTLLSEYGSLSSDTLMVQLLSDYNDNNIDEDVFAIAMSKTGTAFNVDIKHFVQYWLDQKDNFGIKVSAADQEKSVTKTAIYNEKISNADLKPRLQITFTDIK